MTRDVIRLVNGHFTGYPGRLDDFDRPGTPAATLQSPRAFIEDRQPLFGRYQDARWPDDPWIY